MSSLVILLTGKQSQLSFLIYKCMQNLSLSSNINVALWDIKIYIYITAHFLGLVQRVNFAFPTQTLT